MCRRPRFLVVALPVVLVAAALWIRPAPSRPISPATPEIEPTLPLALDLIILPADSGRGEPPRLEASLSTSVDLQDVALSLVLPEGVSAGSGVLSADSMTLLRAGERREYVVPLQAARAGAFPIRLEAAFRLSDGRVIHTQQGVMWRYGVVPPEGRHNAGAYEWMGVPVGEPQP